VVAAHDQTRPFSNQALVPVLRAFYLARFQISAASPPADATGDV